ncbi:MAG TPA: peptidase M13, partial [Porphyromonadaceae bacterium]|nr:peptidase M13 [Porphyromonadaceae bacterium]
DLILNLSKDPQSKVKGTNAQKVSDLFSLGMDSVRRNNDGAAPMKPYLDRINAAKLDSPKSVAEMTAWMHNGVGSCLFATGVGADAKNSDMNIMHIAETGLGLGDRDYYLEKSEDNDRIMAAYEKYVKTLMTLSGYSDADADRVWNTLITIETEFAKNKMSREQRRNPQLRYNIRTMDELRAAYPNIDWDTYFAALGITSLDKVNVASVQFIDFINNYVTTLTPQQLRDYMTWEFISESSNLLSDDFVNANFEMFDRVMSGKTEMEPRWKRAMSLPNSMLGEALGELYVAKYFPKENKEYMVTLVENLRKALGKHIDNLTWMSAETKAKAHEKLNGFTVKIGYPDKWKDYSGIDIDPEKNLLENVLAASRWFTQDNYNKLNKPVDKTEWLMTPQTVNAYYMPTTNEICFPAAILQAPYFDVTADDAINYGAIGVVIGHEMTHGFDDQGRQYDVNGNLNDWWQPADAEAFTKLADQLAAQFDAVEVAPGVHANGRFTLGENIADQGGLRVALTAYLDSQEGKQMKDIDGISPLQRFYLGYANLWAGNIREAEILVRTKTDPHSLGCNRVNVSLRNIEQFFDAFGIKAGDKMFRPENERVIIW